MNNKCMTQADGVTLREYIEARLSAHEKAQDEALKLARDILDVRLEGMNGVKADMLRMENSFMTRNEYEAKHDILQRQVDVLRIESAKLEGKASQSALDKTMWIAIIGLVIGIIGAVHSFYI